MKLQAHEIEALLSGNTAVGKWEGQAYRQFFDPDGSTIYAQEDARSTLGKWRVDVARDEYQSIWPRDADWEGWFVMEFGGDFFWVSKSTPPTPFRVVEGQQLLPVLPVPDAKCMALSEWSKGEDGQVRALVASGSPAVCGTSLGLGGTQSRHCSWAFDYRAPKARDALAALNALLEACFEGTLSEGNGALVNHPDSYDFKSYQTTVGRISSSLKDKGALQQTFVFLRAERPAQ